MSAVVTGGFAGGVFLMGGLGVDGLGGSLFSSVTLLSEHNEGDLVESGRYEVILIFRRRECGGHGVVEMK